MTIAYGQELLKRYQTPELKLRTLIADYRRRRHGGLHPVKAARPVQQTASGQNSQVKWGESAALAS
jgi:hypothetical protein